jgi:hypothetical protein
LLTGDAVVADRGPMLTLLDENGGAEVTLTTAE